jgi:hypothetical protein
MTSFFIFFLSISHTLGCPFVTKSLDQLVTKSLDQHMNQLFLFKQLFFYL